MIRTARKFRAMSGRGLSTRSAASCRCCKAPETTHGASRIRAKTTRLSIRVTRVAVADKSGHVGCVRHEGKRAKQELQIRARQLRYSQTALGLSSHVCHSSEQALCAFQMIVAPQHECDRNAPRVFLNAHHHTNTHTHTHTPSGLDSLCMDGR